jgi:predicted nucleic acid-binding protein
VALGYGDDCGSATSTRGEHEFWFDAIAPATMAEVRTATTAKQITDSYLLGLARRQTGRVMTFDRAFAAAGGDDVLCL